MPSKAKQPFFQDLFERKFALLNPDIPHLLPRWKRCRMTIGSAVKSGPSNVAPLVLRMAVRVLAVRPCRWSEIGAELDHASRENVLALPVAAENAAAAWEDLD